MKKKLTVEQKQSRALSKLGSVGGTATFLKYGKKHFSRIGKLSAISRRKKKLAKTK